jgi:hypothetical protein
MHSRITWHRVYLEHPLIKGELVLHMWQAPGFCPIISTHQRISCAVTNQKGEPEAYYVHFHSLIWGDAVFTLADRRVVRFSVVDPVWPNLLRRLRLHKAEDPYLRCLVLQQCQVMTRHIATPLIP